MSDFITHFLVGVNVLIDKETCRRKQEGDSVSTCGKCLTYNIRKGVLLPTYSKKEIEAHNELAQAIERQKWNWNLSHLDLKPTAFLGH